MWLWAQARKVRGLKGVGGETPRDMAVLEWMGIWDVVRRMRGQGDGGRSIVGVVVGVYWDTKGGGGGQGGDA